MAVRCEHCGREYDEPLFREERVVLCECDRWVEPPERVRRRRQEAERAEVDELRRRADRITSLVLFSDLPEVDIQIEIAGLRRYCGENFPGREALFEMVYVGRWRRLREQGWARGGP